jgi:hypothetical protein
MKKMATRWQSFHPNLRQWRGGAEREIAIIGNMLGVHVGASVELTGRWTVHPDYGKQFAVETDASRCCRPRLPGWRSTWAAG